MREIFFLTLFLSYTSYAQLKPIIQTSRYIDKLTINSDNYYFFGEYYIDPKKKGVIDLNSLKQGIDKVIKDANYTGYIVLDIENKVYNELKTNSIDHINYNKNIKDFVDMVNLVKELRPKAKVVVYNIPFAFSYENQKKYNDFNKLYPLLEVVDAFAPSLYLHYTYEQRNKRFFENYINNNLNLNFEYAEKLNKKIHPFVWYKIHPTNKKYGGSIIDSKQYLDYLNLIKNYKYKNKRVENIIYWESSNKTIDINQKLESTLKILK